MTARWRSSGKQGGATEGPCSLLNVFLGGGSFLWKSSVRRFSVRGSECCRGGAHVCFACQDFCFFLSRTSQNPFKGFFPSVCAMTVSLMMALIEEAGLQCIRSHQLELPTVLLSNVKKERKTDVREPNRLFFFFCLLPGCLF